MSCHSVTGLPGGYLVSKKPLEVLCLYATDEAVDWNLEYIMWDIAGFELIRYWALGEFVPCKVGAGSKGKRFKAEIKAET